MAHLWITWKSLIAWLTPERLLLGLILPAMMILAVTIPPFYAPDEPAHFKRVEGIAAGEILPQTYPAKNGQPFAGAMLDASVPQITSSFIPIEPPLVFSRTRLSTVQSALALRQTGRLRAVAFSNTAIYAPFLYLPSVFAVALGNSANSSVLLTLYSARIANVLMSVALLVLAARIAPQLAGYVVCCSTIPMMEFQSSVVSADAMILPLFVLFACQCWNMQRNVQERPWLFAVVTLLVAAAKVAYIPFAILPVLIALVRDRRISARVLFLACTSFVTVGVWMLWAILVRSSVFSMRSGVVINPTQQLAHVVAHPLYFIKMVVQQFDIEKGFLVSSAFGRYVGWLNVNVSYPAILISVACLCGSISTSSSQSNQMLTFSIVISLSIMCAVLIVTLLYLQYNAVGAVRVQGLQGRYFLPLFLISLTWSPRLAPSRLVELVSARVPLITAAFSFVYVCLQVPRWWLMS